MLKTLWKANWAPHFAWVGTVVGGAVPLVHQVLTDGRVIDTLNAMHLDPKVMLGVAIASAVTLVAVEH